MTHGRHPALRNPNLCVDSRPVSGDIGGVVVFPLPFAAEKANKTEHVFFIA